MAAQTNALIVRFKVDIIDPNGVTTEVRDVTEVQGFSLGEEGTIEVPEWDRNALISDGKRKIPEITMKYRLMNELVTHNYFIEWWDTRHGCNRDIVITWANRAWEPLFRWTYSDCEFVKFMGEDQELGQTKLGIIELKFLPYEVTLVNPNI